MLTIKIRLNIDTFLYVLFPGLSEFYLAWLSWLPHSQELPL